MGCYLSKLSIEHKHQPGSIIFGTGRPKREKDVSMDILELTFYHYAMRHQKPHLNLHMLYVLPLLYDTLSDNSFHHWALHVLVDFIWTRLAARDTTKTITSNCIPVENERRILEHILEKRPQLLLVKISYYLIDLLVEKLPPDDLHCLLTNTRNANRQTCMFLIPHREFNSASHSPTVSHEPFIRLYISRPGDLYELLSIQDVKGQTALHVNTSMITYLLADLYTPNQRQLFIKLNLITDHNNKTALSVANIGLYNLYSLVKRVEDNQYISDTSYDTNILIIYNTNKRPRAEEEAYAIYNACVSIYKHDSVELVKNRNRHDIFEEIEQAAKKRNKRGIPFKAFVVILASHGSTGTIDDANGVPVKLSEIEEVICTHAKDLEGKPKMLITQCCQGSEKESDDRLPYVPTHAHFFAVMSTVSGGSERGVFLVKLSEFIRGHKRCRNIFKIMELLSKDLALNGHQQTPIIMGSPTAGFGPTDCWWQ